MDINYDNNDINNYLVCRYSDKDILDRVGIEMLSNNSIRGLLCPVFVQTDAGSIIRFDISGKRSLREYISRESIDKRGILDMLENIADVLTGLTDYFLDAGSVLLDTDYIFVDNVSGELKMICVPIKTNTYNVISISDFIKDIVFNIHPQKSENSFYYSELITFLSNREKFTLTGFKKLITRLKNESEAENIESCLPAESTDIINTELNDSVYGENGCFMPDVHNKKVNVFIPDANVILNTSIPVKKRNLINFRLPDALTNIIFNILNK
ncbi:MAG: hypothetical protein IJM37_02385 [Lachnospiraceae bacterium]|nr:hypothetical protein [Lachnospiraceae bacterium]